MPHPTNTNSEGEEHPRQSADDESTVRSPLPQVVDQLIPSSDTDVVKPNMNTTNSSTSSSLSSGPSFDNLRNDFNVVLSNIWHDRSESSLEKFRAEYDKLLSVIRKHQENERRLINKCHELNSEIVNNAAKIQTAIRLSFQDQQHLSAVKGEMDKAWKLVDMAAEKREKT